MGSSLTLIVSTLFLFIYYLFISISSSDISIGPKFHETLTHLNQQVSYISPEFSSPPDLYKQQLKEIIGSTLTTYSLPHKESRHSFHLRASQQLVRRHGNLAFAAGSLFLLGILPVFVPPQHRDSTMHRRIAQNAHTRIWGDVRRRHTPRSKANPALTTHPTCPRKTLTLPAHLARIVPQPSLPRVFLKFPLISLFPSLRFL